MTTSQSKPQQQDAPPAGRTNAQRRALAVIAVAQLLLVMDGTLMNIALPRIQTGLDVSPAALTWVVTAYALGFGGLLLVAGRLGDIFGHQRLFTIGMTVFAVASLIGTVAPNSAVLIAARGLQGVAAAIAAPNALSLISSTFPDRADHQRAMGVYGAMSGLGSTVGLLLGGVLTSYLNWRWALLINVPIALWIILNRKALVQARPSRGRIDVWGAVTGTLAAVALVYGATRAGEEEWSDDVVVGCLALAALSAVVFVIIQIRSHHPLVPSDVVRSRPRAGAYLTQLLVGASMFATYYFLTLHMQSAMGYDALQTGLAYLPLSVTLAIAAGAVAPRLLQQVSGRAIAAGGLLLAAVGAGWLSQLEYPTSYATSIVPATVLIGLGLGLAFVSVTLTGMAGVEPQKMGAASSVLNTALQIGGAIGMTVLVTRATQVADARVPGAVAIVGRSESVGWSQAVDAVTRGYASAFVVVAAIYVVAAAIVVSTFRTQHQDR
ncbi:MAG TPA: MFS transporter [Jatrophihabitans sp.]|jgi:EmrB/QacA subfamily drug resistance transporter|uniref:MFS transporter n=1 Tax=Jatrophihabitans sp. TaxID=1932789 RepID=UPI002F1E32C7